LGDADEGLSDAASGSEEGAVGASDAGAEADVEPAGSGSASWEEADAGALSPARNRSLRRTGTSRRLSVGDESDSTAEAERAGPVRGVSEDEGGGEAVSGEGGSLEGAGVVVEERTSVADDA
jgi:hypothetical protein